METNSIFFCGDVHGNFPFVIQAVLVHRPASVIFLGDLQAQRPLEQELAPILALTDIWYIHGNHDTDSEADYDNLFQSALADRNLHGRVVEIAGKRIAGLGGVFRGGVWYPPEGPDHDSVNSYIEKCGKGNQWRGGLPRKHRSTIFPADYFNLIDRHADILVTHEAPSCHPNGFLVIDDLARSLGVHTTFHGHQHDRLNYTQHRERMGFTAYGVGFCGITDQDGNIICVGDFDEKTNNDINSISGKGGSAYEQAWFSPHSLCLTKRPAPQVPAFDLAANEDHTMILFLDFDGVLHHENVTLHKCKSPTALHYLKEHERRYLTATGHYVKGKNLFEHCDRLAACLAPYPNIQIVISSSWREHYRHGALLSFLPHALDDRVIGQTPYCDKYGGVGSRLNEILAYLEGNGLAAKPWIAIDDQAQLFCDDTENPPDNLFIIGNDGLTETAALAFSQFLHEITKS